MKKLLFGNWEDVFLKEVSTSKQNIKIISPFVSKDAIALLNQPLKAGVSVQLITRLSDRDFLASVSDIEALLGFSRAGGQICAQSKSLHAKIYIYDNARAIVTSSNLTYKGLARNSEIGVYLADSELVEELVAHFSSQWKKLAPPFSESKLQEIAEHIKTLKLQTSGFRKEPPGVKDHGKDVDDADAGQGTGSKGGASPSARGRPQKITTGQRRFWVKFVWSRKDPADSDEPVHKYAGRTCAITFPKNPGRPNKINTGDFIFQAALTTGKRGRDWVVYARGSVAAAHRRGVDELPEKTLKAYPSLKRYPYLVWLYDVDLIGKDLNYGVSLHELFDKLGDNSFLWSQERAERGDSGRHIEAIRYHRSHIELTQEAVEFLNSRLEAAFERAGKIHKDSGDDVWWNQTIANPKFRYKKVAI